MTTIAVIPARYASTRFPGKPLANETGKYLIQHTYEAVARCKLIDRTIVATDDQRILEAVESFGGEARMTNPHHPNGTLRVGEVVSELNLNEQPSDETSRRRNEIPIYREPARTRAGDTRYLNDNDIVLNVQGDEPDIEPASLERLINRLSNEGSNYGIATLAAPFADNGPTEGPGSPLDPSCVKVVLGQNGRALYFSRSLIPYPRATQGKVDRPSRWLLHLGVYAFRAGMLQQIVATTDADDRARFCSADEPRALAREVLQKQGDRTIAHGRAAPSDSLEAIESLEQLGWLGKGYAISVEIVDKGCVGIDTPEDYAAFVARHRPSAIC